METKEQFDAIMASSLFRTDGADIDILDALSTLCDCIEEEDETDWNLGECLECSLADLIAGAYWALSDWHGGQWAQSYSVLCQLGSIFSPGPICCGPEEENGEYIAYEMVCSVFSGK